MSAFIAVAEESSVDPGELREAALTWRRGRVLKRRWLSFLSRPLDAGSAGGTRHFLARRDGRLVGYALFDPIFSDGRVVAYGPSLSAFTPAFRNGLYYVVVEAAARRFREEGVAAINLGLSPLDIVAPDFPFESRPLRCGLAGLRLTGDRLYNFAGLSFIKRKFYGAQTPVFAAHESRLPALELYGFLRLSGIV